MKTAQDIFEVKFSWKGIKELKEAQQKFNTLLETEQWTLNSIEKFYEKEKQVIEHLLKQLSTPNSIFQFQIGNGNYPVKKFERIKELLLRMIQCKDIENLEIHDINLKEIEEEFRDFLHERPITYDKGVWHTLK